MADLQYYDQVILIIDSSFLRQYPLFKTDGFQNIVDVLNEYRITVFIPEIVKREVISARIYNAHDTIKKSQKSLNSLSRILPNELIDEKKFTINTELDSLYKMIEKIVLDDWDYFEENTNYLNIDLNSSHALDVFEAYFKGDSPFSGVKKRDDIPDAFIYFCIKSIFEEYDEVIFLSKDQQLFEAVNELNICTYTDIKDIVKAYKDRRIEEIFTKKDRNKYTQFMEENEERIKSMLSNRLVNYIENDCPEYIMNENGSTDFKILKIEQLSFESYQPYLFWIIDERAIETIVEVVFTAKSTQRKGIMNEVNVFFSPYIYLMFDKRNDDLILLGVEIVAHSDIFIMNAT